MSRRNGAVGLFVRMRHCVVGPVLLDIDDFDFETSADDMTERVRASDFGMCTMTLIVPT